MIAETNPPPTNRLSDDPNSFGEVYDRLHKAIFGYVFRRVADYELTCDIVSETFLKAFLKRSSFESRGGVPVDAWIYRIATNEINLYFRRQRYEPESLTQLTDLNGFDPIAPETLEAERAEAERHLQQHEDFARIQSFLRTMPTDYQTAIALRYFEEKSLQEIADIMQKPVGTVKSLLSRGVDKLRSEFCA